MSESPKLSRLEDADDLRAFELRELEKDLSFAAVVTDLKRRGKL